MRKTFNSQSDAIEPCGLSCAELRKLTDEQLMGHVRAGDGDALGVLFDRFHRLVLHVALKVLHDVGEAEDVMQTVFMGIYKLAVQFDPARGTAKMWIMRYAYHRSINRRRHLFVRNFYNSSGLDDLEDDLLASDSDIVASQEARELIAENLPKLSAAQRRVLEMAFFDGLTMKEIAQKINDSLGNIRHHYYRGLDKMRSCLCEANQAKNVGLARKEIRDAKA